MKRISFLTLLILLSLAAGALHAQDSAFVVMTIPVESMAAVTVLSPDDQTVVVYNQFQIYSAPPTPELIAVHLLDINTGDEVGILSGYTDWVTGLSYNSDGSQIVTFHRNGDVNLWNAADQSLIKTIPLYIYGGSTWAQFHPDNQTVLYRAGQFILGALNLDSGAITQLFGQRIATFVEFEERYLSFPGQADLLIAASTISPDGKWLATSTANDTVYLWDIESGERYQLRGSSEKMAQFAIPVIMFSSDSRQLVYFDDIDKQTHVWDVISREEIGVYAFGALVFALAPDDATLVWGDRQSGMIYTAELAAGSVPVEVLALPDQLRVARNVTSLAFTSDGSRLVVGGLFNSDGTTNIYVVDLASG